MTTIEDEKSDCSDVPEDNGEGASINAESSVPMNNQQFPMLDARLFGSRDELELASRRRE